MAPYFTGDIAKFLTIAYKTLMPLPPMASHVLTSMFLLTSYSHTTLTAASGAPQACSHHGFFAFVLP